jgi:hypothetical protein
MQRGSAHAYVQPQTNSAPTAREIGRRCEIGDWLACAVPTLANSMRQALVAFSAEGWLTIDDLLDATLDLVSASSVFPLIHWRTLDIR